MSSKILLRALIPVLLVFNCFIIFNYGLEASRWARLCSTAILFLLWTLQGSWNIKMLGAFLLLISSDLMLFYYENSLGNTATFLMRISAYLLLTIRIFPLIRGLRTSSFQKFIFFLVFTINLVMLVFLVDMVPAKFGYPLMNLLFYAYGISLIIWLIAAVSYNNRYSDKPSLYYAAAAIFLVFGDITSFIAYYLEFYEFYYPDRIFYILGIAALIKFSAFESSHRTMADLESL